MTARRILIFPLLLEHLDFCQKGITVGLEVFNRRAVPKNKLVLLLSLHLNFLQLLLQLLKVIFFLLESQGLFEATFPCRESIGLKSSFPFFDLSWTLFILRRFSQVAIDNLSSQLCNFPVPYFQRPEMTFFWNIPAVT